MTNDRLATQLLHWLRPLEIRAVKLRLEAEQDVTFSISTLRGVWGRALHLVDREIYNIVFEGKAGKKRQPLYIIRPDLQFRSENRRWIGIEWITWGEAVGEPYWNLQRAWDVAGGMGLGDKRTPFVVRGTQSLCGDANEPFSLGDVAIDELRHYDDMDKLCRLNFPHSLRLVRKDRLIAEPSLADVIESVFFRLSPFLSENTSARPRDLWPPMAEAVVALAETLPNRWQGEEIVMERYSGRQKQEVRQHAVVGSLDLPHGPGPLWPLLTAASLLHIGKGTVMGLGRLQPLVR